MGLIEGVRRGGGGRGDLSELHRRSLFLFLSFSGGLFMGWLDGRSAMGCWGVGIHDMGWGLDMGMERQRRQWWIMT